MANGKPVVGGHVSRAEARAAEGGFHHRARAHKRLGRLRSREREANRHAGRIDGERKLAVARGAAVEDFAGFDDVVKQTARATRDDALIGIHAVGLDLALEVECGLREGRLCFLLHFAQQLVRARDKLANRVGVARMERQRNHALHFVELDGDHAIVIGAFFRRELGIGFRSSVRAEELRRLAVGLPDGAQARGLRGHHVHAVAIVGGEVLDARAYELQNLVFCAAFGKRFFHEREGNVVRADAAAGFPRYIAEHDLRRRDVIGVFEQLLDQLRPAFANREGTKRAIARVAVRTQNHPPATRELFARIAVDDAQVCGHIDAAVFFRGGKPEYMVVLIDGAADGAEAVVAVGHRIGHGEFSQSARPRGLHDADIGDVVRNQRIETQPELLHVAGNVVRAENGIGDGLFARGFFVCSGGMRPAVVQGHRMVMIANHRLLLDGLTVGIVVFSLAGERVETHR